MKRIVLKAYAKINWALDVLSKRPDGYHDVEMVMQSVNLCDTVILEERDSGISVRCGVDGVPVDKTNTAYRATALIKDRFKIEKGVEIEIKKNIPVAAGLAGGSADAAAVLVGLNKMWRLNLSKKELMDLAGIVGSDVPFCIVGGTALARGRGEDITALPPAEGIWLVLITPEQRISTAEVYKKLDLNKIHARPDIADMVDSLRQRNFKGIARNMVNVLEGVTVGLCPQIKAIEEDIMRQRAVGCCMSGSGPTVYGLFEDKHMARRAYAALKQRYSQCFVAQTVSLGVQVVEEVF